MCYIGQTISSCSICQNNNCVFTFTYLQVDVMVGSTVIPFISYTKIPIDSSVCNMSTNIISTTYAHSTNIVSQTPTDTPPETKTETGKCTDIII